MKKLIFLFIALFTIAGVFAQEAVVESSVVLVTTFAAIKTFFLPYFSGQILFLIAEAKKHLTSSERDWGIWAKTNALPILITTGGGIILYYALSYMTFLKPFIEVLSGENLSVLSAATLGAAAVGIYKGLVGTSDKE